MMLFLKNIYSSCKIPKCQNDYFYCTINETVKLDGLKVVCAIISTNEMVKGCHGGTTGSILALPAFLVYILKTACVEFHMFSLGSLVSFHLPKTCQQVDWLS